LRVEGLGFRVEGFGGLRVREFGVSGWGFWGVGHGMGV
jgi:hypothetical protein